MGRAESKAWVERMEFDAYYDGSRVAHALHVSHVWEHGAPVALGTLRGELPDFRSPQSWRYAKGRELCWLEEFKRGAEPIPEGFQIDFLLPTDGLSGLWTSERTVRQLRARAPWTRAEAVSASH